MREREPSVDLTDVSLAVPTEEAIVREREPPLESLENQPRPEPTEEEPMEPVESETGDQPSLENQPGQEPTEGESMVVEPVVEVPTQTVPEPSVEAAAPVGTIVGAQTEPEAQESELAEGASQQEQASQEGEATAEGLPPTSEKVPL